MPTIDPIFAIIIIFFSAIVHEVAHGYAALWQGDVTAKYEGRLTLNPLVHLDIVGSIIVPLLLAFGGLPVFGWAKPVPFNPYNFRNQRWGEAFVAFAGPAVNICIALFFALIIRAPINFGGAALSLMALIILINLVLAIFNLIPIPPLDGSKILFAFLPIKYHSIIRKLERYSFLFVIVFVFFGWKFIVPLILIPFGLLVGMPLG